MLKCLFILPIYLDDTRYLTIDLILNNIGRNSPYLRLTILPIITKYLKMLQKHARKIYKKLTEV